MRAKGGAGKIFLTGAPPPPASATAYIGPTCKTISSILVAYAIIFPQHAYARLHAWPYTCCKLNEMMNNFMP